MLRKRHDAITLLTADHRLVNAKLEELVHASQRAPKRRDTLCAEIVRMLEAHMIIEEELFYPAFQAAGKNADDRRMGAEAREEHRAAKAVLKDLLTVSSGTLEFGGRAKVLKELVEHHVEEEESDLFPRVRELIPQERLEQLGMALETRRAQILGQAQPRSAAARRASRGRVTSARAPARRAPAPRRTTRPR